MAEVDGTIRFELDEGGDEEPQRGQEDQAGGGSSGVHGPLYREEEASPHWLGGKAEVRSLPVLCEAGGGCLHHALRVFLVVTCEIAMPEARTGGHDLARSDHALGDGRPGTHAPIRTNDRRADDSGPFLHLGLLLQHDRTDDARGRVDAHAGPGVHRRAQAVPPPRSVRQVGTMRSFTAGSPCSEPG
jgi:hypothetical protein